MEPIKGTTNGINGTGGLSGKSSQKDEELKDKGFDRLLDETIGKVSTLQKEADQAIKELTSGEGDIVKAMIAMQKAEISFQTMIEVRNKLVSAYEEIMRMQV
jgi:flagellar hook-basal body complex protein FliE